MFGRSNLSILNPFRSGINSLSFLIVKNELKNANASKSFAHTPKFAQPPLSPDLAPNKVPRGTWLVSPFGASGIFTGSI